MRRGGSNVGVQDESQLPGQSVIDRPNGNKKAKTAKKAVGTSSASLQDSADSYMKGITSSKTLKVKMHEENQERSSTYFDVQDQKLKETQLNRETKIKKGQLDRELKILSTDTTHMSSPHRAFFAE